MQKGNAHRWLDQWFSGRVVRGVAGGERCRVLFDECCLDRLGHDGSEAAKDFLRRFEGLEEKQRGRVQVLSPPGVPSDLF